MSGTKSSASASSSSKAASKEEKKEKEEDEMKVVVSAAEKEEKEDLKTTTENVADEDEDEEKKASNKSKTKSTSDVQRLPRPSREKHETAMKRLNEQIEERKKTIESAKSKIKVLRDGREKEQAKYAPIRSKLNELAAQCQILMQTRDACRKEVQALDNMGKGERDGGSGNRGGGKSAEQIDAEMARIEDQLSHETMSLKEEKVLVEKIKQLNKMKDSARAMAAKQARITGTDGSRKAMQEKAKAKDVEINANKAEQQKLKNEIDKIRGVEGGGNNKNKKENGKSGNSGGGDNFNKNVKALESERDGAYKQILKIRKEMDDLRDDFKKKNNEWLKREKVFRAERDAEENAPEPFEAEISSCDQLVSFLQKFLPKSAPAEATSSSSKNGSAEDLTAKLSGLKMVNKRDKDEEMDDLLSMTGTLTKAKKNKVNAMKNAGPKPPKETDKVNLSLDAYGMFGKVGISAPLIVGEVPRCVELLNEKKEEFLEKRKVKKERIAAGLEDPVVEEESKDEEKKEKTKGGGDGGGGKMLVTVSFEVKEDEKTVVVSISPKKED
ncbi:unnamed protein product [Bathycoccus prasinos]